MGGFKKYIFGDVVLSVIGLGGAKNGSKKGGVALRLGVFIEKHRGRNEQFFLSILVAHRLSILQGYPLREETHSNSGYTTNPTNHQKCY